MQVEIRAARTLVEAEGEGETRDAAPGAEERERVELRSRCRVGNILAATLAGRGTSGPELELQSELGFASSNIPTELWQRPERRDGTETRAISPTPSTVGVNMADRSSSRRALHRGWVSHSGEFPAGPTRCRRSRPRQARPRPRQRAGPGAGSPAARMMPNPKVSVTQAEVRRYFKGIREAGFGEGRIEIERLDGTRVSIVAGKASEATADDADDIDFMIGKIP